MWRSEDIAQCMAPQLLAVAKHPRRRGDAMLHYAVVFFVIALIAAVLGLRGIAGLSAEIGWLFAVLAVVFLVIALLSGRGPTAIP